MRPVWRRRQQRIYGNVNDLPPPSEEEKGDAILVLADPKMEKQAPALWYEAFRVFEEASIPFDADAAAFEHYDDPANSEPANGVAGVPRS